MYGGGINTEIDLFSNLKQTFATQSSNQIGWTPALSARHCNVRNHITLVTDFQLYCKIP